MKNKINHTIKSKVFLTLIFLALICTYITVDFIRDDGASESEEEGVYSMMIPYDIPYSDPEFKQFRDYIKQALPQDESKLLFNYMNWVAFGGEGEPRITVREVIVLQKEYIKKNGKMILSF